MLEKWILHAEVQEEGVSTPMPSLGPNPTATGLLNCILKPTSTLSREGVSSCLAAGMVTQLPLNLGKGAEDRGRCLASSSSSRHPTLSTDRLCTRLCTSAVCGPPLPGFPLMTKATILLGAGFPTHFGCKQRHHKLELWVSHSRPSRHGP